MQINLLATVDKNYIRPLVTALESYARFHKNDSTRLFIAHSSIGDEIFEELNGKFSPFGIEVVSIKITEKWFSETPVLERLPEESFYRLMAFHYLPKDVERCLYLDPDIYILKPLNELYETNIDGKYIAAASHTYGFKNSFNKMRLGIKNRYLNSGIMLFNIAEIRKDFTVEKILSSLEENMQVLFMGDQDLANILFGERSVLLDEMLYNLDERTYKHNKKKYDLNWVKENTVIVHYNGKYKPWLEEYNGELDVFYPNVEKAGSPSRGKVKNQARAIHAIMRLKPRQKLMLAGFLAVLIACVISYFIFGNEIIKIVSDPVVFRQWLDKFGAFDEIIFILIRTIQTVIKFIPAEPLEIGAGYAWGTVLGMIYCLAANMIGTVFIWFFTKKYGRKFVEFFIPIKNLESYSFFKSSSHIYTLLFLFFLIPGSPKDGFTYFAGLMPIKFVPFMIVTGIARIPSILVSTYCGETLAQKQYLFSALILIITAVLAVLCGLLYAVYVKKQNEKSKKSTAGAA